MSELCAELTPGANFCTRCGFQLDHPARQIQPEADTGSATAEDETATTSPTAATGDTGATGSTQATAEGGQAEPTQAAVSERISRAQEAPHDDFAYTNSAYTNPTQPRAAAAGPIPAGAGLSFFDGGLLSWLGYRILGIIVTVITLGICLPWAWTMMYAWEARHTVINGHRMYFNGTAIGLFGHWLLWWFLTLITFGIYGFWVFIMLKKWRAKHTIFLF